MLARQLRRKRNVLHSEKIEFTDAELAYKRGCREDIQGILEYLLEERFGALPDDSLEAISAIQRVDDLQGCLNRLPEAASWREVLELSESAS